MGSLRQALRYEYRSLRTSPQLSLIIGLFVLLMGVVLLSAIRDYTTLHQTEPLLTRLFQALWVPSLLILPALSVSVFFSRLPRQLLELPPWQMVFSKFVVAMTAYLGLWLFASFSCEIAHWIAPSLPVEKCVAPHVRWGGLYFVTAWSSVLIAVDLWICSCTSAPMAALMATSCAHFLILLFGGMFQGLALLSSPMGYSLYTDHNLWTQLGDCCHGILDTRIVTGYGAVTFIFLCLAAITLRRE
ncbi:MAG: hypothetical protein K2L24_01215 [Opitutales bacterium]|nr:hypothetical protein [Opitutales bacterium]